MSKQALPLNSNGNRRKSFPILVAALITLGVPATTVIAAAPNSAPSEVQEVPARTDAAFRDGLYLGRLDAQNGRSYHLPIGRWRTPDDRLSFVVGYLQGHGK
jgi:hypothetical protein